MTVQTLPLYGYVMPKNTHTEPCGCIHEQTDVPDDQMYGQGWRWIQACAEHWPTAGNEMIGHLDERYYPR